MSEGEGGEKEHEPTPKKLDDARRQGDVVHSADLTGAAGYLGLLVTLAVAGGWVVEAAGGQARHLIADADRLSVQLFRSGSSNGLGLAGPVLLAALSLFLVPAAAAMLSVIAQRAGIVAPDRIAPKLSRINPLRSLAHRFGPDGLFEFAKGLLKLSVVSLALWYFISSRLDVILPAARLEPRGGAALLGEMAFDFLVLVTATGAGFGTLDFLWQKLRFLQRNRMSRQELIDELRQSDGDPHVKGQRRQRAQEIATNRMLADVPRADVVIVNPTHYAVALRWNRSAGRAPTCVAKGTDAIAARIRAAASEAGVPIRSDPPTARRLYAEVAIGSDIGPDHYRAVAAAIRFAEQMRTRAKKRGILG